MTFAAFALTVADTAEEGRNIILIMLAVGLLFCAVVAIGNGLRWLSHRRHPEYWG